MKTVIRSYAVFAVVMVGTTLGRGGQAALITPTSQFWDAAVSPFAPPSAPNLPSGTDLINAGRPSFLSVTPDPSILQQNSTSTGALNDGLLGDPTSITSGFPNNLLTGRFRPLSDGEVVTFNLNTTANSYGYNITQIQSWAGYQNWWLVNQSYDVAVHYVGAAPGNFDLLSSPRNMGVDLALQATENAQTWTRVSIGDGTAVIASGVDQIRFTFYDALGYNGGIVSTQDVFAETDVFGSAVIPEPSVVALLLVGSGAWWLRRNGRR